MIYGKDFNIGDLILEIPEDPDIAQTNLYYITGSDQNQFSWIRFGPDKIISKETKLKFNNREYFVDTTFWKYILKKVIT